MAVLIDDFKQVNQHPVCVCACVCLMCVCDLWTGVALPPTLQWKAQMTAEVQSLYSAVSSCHSTQQGHYDDREGVAQLTRELQKT